MTGTTKKARKRKAKGPFSDELLDQLLAQATGKDAESLLGESGLIGQLKKQLAERMLAAELSHHLASEAAEEGAGNHLTGESNAVLWLSRWRRVSGQRLSGMIAMSSKKCFERGAPPASRLRASQVDIGPRNWRGCR